MCLHVAADQAESKHIGDSRNRGKPITPSGGGARLLLVETNRPVEAVVAARLKPDGDRSRVC